MGGGTPVMSPAAKRLASSVRVKDDANSAVRLYLAYTKDLF